jgi:hypothetical protein
MECKYPQYCGKERHLSELKKEKLLQCSGESNKVTNALQMATENTG